VRAPNSARDELLKDIETGTVRCGVIGLGFIGTVLMDALIAAGITARGFDRSEAAVTRFREHQAACEDRVASQPCAVGADPGVLEDCNVIFVAVRKLVSGSVFDDEPLNAAGRLLAQHSVRPCLVILESTVAPGTTRRFAEAITTGCATALFVAHAPERLSAGHDHRNLRSTPHLVAGIDDDATRLAAAMLAKLCDRVVTVSAPEVSEISKLLENAFLSVNIGLTSEITRLCMSLHVPAQEVCRAAATKPRGFMPFYPGPGLGGHCLPNDLQILAQSARDCGWEPDLLNAAIAVNDRAPSLVVDRIEGSLTAAGVPMKGASVLLVGVGFKAGSSDTTRSPAIDVVRTLRGRGATVAYVDTGVAGFTVDDVPVTRIPSASLAPRCSQAARFAVGVLLSGARDLPEECLLGACDWILDAGGSRMDRPRVAGIETL